MEQVEEERALAEDGQRRPDPAGERARSTAPRAGARRCRARRPGSSRLAGYLEVCSHWMSEPFSRKSPAVPVPVQAADHHEAPARATPPASTSRAWNGSGSPAGHVGRRPAEQHHRQPGDDTGTATGNGPTCPGHEGRAPAAPCRARRRWARRVGERLVEDDEEQAQRPAHPRPEGGGGRPAPPCSPRWRRGPGAPAARGGRRPSTAGRAPR